MNRTDYLAYLQSGTWRHKRINALRTAKGRCRLCNGTDNLEVHHRTYARVGRERAADLTVLCAECHVAFHNRVGKHLA